MNQTRTKFVIIRTVLAGWKYCPDGHGKWNRITKTTVVLLVLFFHSYQEV